MELELEDTPIMSDQTCTGAEVLEDTPILSEQDSPGDGAVAGNNQAMDRDMLIKDKNSNPTEKIEQSQRDSRPYFWVNQSISSDRNGITLDDISDIPVDSAVLHRILRSPGKTRKSTMKDFHEGMKLSAKIMKKGLNHRGSYGPGPSWLEVKKKKKTEKKRKSQFLERLLADDKEEEGINPSTTTEEEKIQPGTTTESDRKRRLRSSSRSVGNLWTPPPPSSLLHSPLFLYIPMEQMAFTIPGKTR